MALLIEMLIILAVLVGIALVAVGRGGALREDDPDRVDTRIPPPGVEVRPADVDGIRFGLAFRGYRMDEVDDAMDRLRDEIALLRAAAPPPLEERIVEPEPEPEPEFQSEPEPEPEPELVATASAPVEEAEPLIRWEPTGWPATVDLGPIPWERTEPVQLQPARVEPRLAEPEPPRA